MFQSLYDVARHTPLHLIITPNGPQLKIIVTPKPSGLSSDNSALAKPFSVVGTPAELDAEFAGAVQKYTEAVNEVRKSLDLPLDALEAEKAKKSKKEEAKAERERQKTAEEEKRKAAAVQAAKTRADNAAKKKAEEEARKQARADKRAAKKRPAAMLPGATQPLPAAPVAPVGADDTNHRPELPGKPECIKDYQQLKLKHGEALTRRLFIKKADTGRRYEKLWPNWAKFVKEAGAQQELPLDLTTPYAASPASVRESYEKEVEDNRPAAESGAGSVNSADDEALPRKGEGKGTSTDVYDEWGGYLSSITTKPVLGEHIGLVSQEKLLRITAIDERPGGGLDVTVVPDADETARRAKAVADQVLALAAERTPDPEPRASATEKLESIAVAVTAADPAAEKPNFKVYTDEDELIAVFKWTPQIGEKITVDGGAYPFRVLAVEGQRVIARRILPTKNRLIAEGSGELLGHTEEVYDIADQVVEITDKEYRVVKVELDAYVVKAAKPRVKGPVATTEPAVTE